MTFDQVIPSILTESVISINTQITRLLPYFSSFQIDIVDGKLYNNKTAQLEDILKAYEHNQFSIPGNISFDFDLMVEDNDGSLSILRMLQNYASISTVFLHSANASDFIRLTKEYTDYSIGLALAPKVQVSHVIEHYDISTIPAIQIMSVEPGGQGLPFLEETLVKIKELREAGYTRPIFEDGGINGKTIPVILSKQYKPDYICPGSYFSKAENIEERVKEVKMLLQST